LPVASGATGKGLCSTAATASGSSASPGSRTRRSSGPAAKTAAGSAAGTIGSDSAGCSRAYLGTNSSPAVYAPNLSTTSFTVTTALTAGTTYYWNVVAKNSGGSAPASSTWSFGTAGGGSCQGGSQTFTANTTWPVPTGCTSAVLQAIGGGGGGQGGTSTSAGAGGGGGGWSTVKSHFRHLAGLKVLREQGNARFGKSCSLVSPPRNPRMIG
jgi:hypothetical protein